MRKKIDERQKMVIDMMKKNVNADFFLNKKPKCGP